MLNQKATTLISFLLVFCVFATSASAEWVKACVLTTAPKEASIDLILNLDSSISFSQQVGFSYGIPEECRKCCENITNMYKIPINLPKGKLDTSMTVVDVLNYVNFERVYDLNIQDCVGKYVLDSETNQIILCSRPINDARFKIDGTLLSIMPYEDLITSKYFYNDANFSFPKYLSGESYSLSLKASGGENVGFYNISKDSCKSVEYADLELHYKLNGFTCEGKIQTTPGLKDLEIRLVGKNLLMIKEEKENAAEKRDVDIAANSMYAAIGSAVAAFLMIFVSILNLMKSTSTTSSNVQETKQPRLKDENFFFIGILVSTLISLATGIWLHYLVKAFDYLPYSEPQRTLITVLGGFPVILFLLIWLYKKARKYY